MKPAFSTKFILFALLLFAASLRLYNINWDQGFHLHPDERAIVMATLNLSWPHSIDAFFLPSSSWNPHFFAYGSFPMYLLKITGDLLSIFNPLFAQYDLITIVGRVLSTFFDLGTIITIYFLGRKIGNSIIGFLAAFLYCVSVLPIQLSHFYAVDTLLTFFSTMTLYQLLRFYEQPRIKNALLVGVFFGLALVTKVSALVLLSATFLAIASDFLFLFIKQPHKIRVWLPHLPKFFLRLLIDGFFIFIATIVTFLLIEPYALIDFQEFWTQSMQQAAMTHNAFIFPYTLQYVGKISYFYELKNIFLWGEGPILQLSRFSEHSISPIWHSAEINKRNGR